MRTRIIKDGIDCFEQNKIVTFLYEFGKELIDLNLLWSLTDKDIFSEKELEEFYQLIGYSVNGYEELFGEIET
jgi:hypothetical protein